MNLKSVLREVPDPRGRQGRDYRLWSILGLILVSMLCGRRGIRAASGSTTPDEQMEFEAQKRAREKGELPWPD